MSLYNELVKDAVRSIKPPHGFRIAIAEYEGFLTIQFYESDWQYLSDKQRYDCLGYIGRVKLIIESFGIRVSLDPILDIKYNDDRQI